MHEAPLSELRACDLEFPGIKLRRDLNHNQSEIIALHVTCIRVQL